MFLFISSQDVLHNAIQIIRIVMGGDITDQFLPPVKKSPGHLDAVLDMPDLFNAGKK